MLSTYYVPVCLCACPQLGPGIGKGERGVDIGGGDPRSPPTLAHTRTQLHKLTFLPVVSRYLSFFPVMFLLPFLPLPYPLPLIISPLKLYLSRSLSNSSLLPIPFSSLPLFFPPSLLLTSELPSQCSSCSPNVHNCTHFTFYVIFLQYLYIFKYVYMHKYLPLCFSYLWDSVL